MRACADLDFSGCAAGWIVEEPEDCARGPLGLVVPPGEVGGVLGFEGCAEEGEDLCA